MGGGCQGEGECVQGHTGLGGGCQGAWCHLVAWTQLPWHCTRNGGTAHEAHACLGCGPGLVVHCCRLCSLWSAGEWVGVGWECVECYGGPSPPLAANHWVQAVWW